MRITIRKSRAMKKKSAVYRLVSTRHRARSVTLKKQIKEKEDSIKERDKQMRARLLEMQAIPAVIIILIFSMGSTSFTDLLRRTEIVGELNSI